MEVKVDLPASLLGRLLAYVGNDATDAHVSAFVRHAVEVRLAVLHGAGGESSSAGAGPVDPAGVTADELFPPVGQPDWRQAEPYPKAAVAGITDSAGREWLWGQVNRVFPLKFLVRAVLARGDDGAVPAEEIYERIGPLARRYALGLRNVDDTRGTRRDNRLDVGFPSGEDEQAALARFLTQFFWSRSEAGTVSGALPLLELTGPLEGDAIALTAAGYQFARLESPLLDHGDSAGPRLSREEQEFYLKHVLSNVPGEAAAFLLLAEAISRGAQTNTEISAWMSERAAAGWSETLLSTQRSGAMSRMIELGLVQREREGVRVRFHLTREGDSLLQLQQEAG